MDYICNQCGATPLYKTVFCACGACDWDFKPTLETQQKYLIGRFISNKNEDFHMTSIREILSLYFELLDMDYEMGTRHLFAPSRYSRESVTNALEEYDELLKCVTDALREEAKR